MTATHSKREVEQVIANNTGEPIEQVDAEVTQMLNEAPGSTVDDIYDFVTEYVGMDPVADGTDPQFVSSANAATDGASDGDSDQDELEEVEEMISEITGEPLAQVKAEFESASDDDDDDSDDEDDTI